MWFSSMVMGSNPLGSFHELRELWLWGPCWQPLVCLKEISVHQRREQCNCNWKV
uniref:Uncharacterized protein n=1 Tax=Rhizophora mucronata TaxID=61149 RepID=A0A2P2P9Y6_RHIMU